MKIENIHLIKNDVNAVFHYPTLTLFEVNDLVYDVLSRLKNNESFESIALETNLKQSDIEALISNISKAITNSHQNDNDETIGQNPSKKIGRITLHVANGCNLRCSYCYADGGNYKLPENLMTPETASQFIDFCVTHFDQVENIVFFGGEPLLNPKIINYICETFDTLYKAGQINHLPVFGIITNGTIINDEIFNIVKKYIKAITVSIDGPQNLNDYNRKFKNGEGSYSKISEFIHKIKTETDIHLKYEATYTSYHRQNKWNESDVKSFLFKEFNIRGSVVPDINYQHPDNTDRIKEDIFPEGFFGVLRSMTNRIYKEMCPIGSNIVAISTEGELYPCHMNNGIKHLSFGHISGENIFNSPNKILSKFPYLKSISQTEKPCVDCWANPVCGGCPMYWFYDKENAQYNPFPNQSFCESNKKQIEDILLLIIRLKKDKAKWAELLERIKTLDDHDSI